VAAAIGMVGVIIGSVRAVAAPATVVLLAQEDAREDARAMVRIVTDSLRGLEVRLVVEAVPALLPDRAARVALAQRLARVHGARAVAWCDFGAVVEVHLFQVVEAGGRLLTRRVEGGGASSAEGRLEIIGAVLLGGVDAILGGGEVGRPVAVAPRPPARVAPPRRPAPLPPSRPRPVRRRVPVALEAGYQITGLSSQLPAAHGGRLVLLVGVHRIVSVGLGYGVSPALSPPAVEGVTLTLHRHQVHLQGALTWPWQRLGIGVQAALVLDLGAHHTEVGPGSVAAPRPDRVEVGAGIEVAAVVQVRLVRWLAVTAGVGAWLGLQRYEYRTGATDGRLLLRPWPVQPIGTLGLRFLIP
jgi:hypothetical protein